MSWDRKAKEEVRADCCAEQEASGVLWRVPAMIWSRNYRLVDLDCEPVPFYGIIRHAMDR